MTTKAPNPVISWLGSNALTLIILVISMTMAWAFLNARVDAIEAKVSQYPSQDWFELKFEGIDERFDHVEIKLDDHIEKFENGQ